MVSEVMELAGTSAPSMDWNRINLPETWKRFKQHVELMFTGPLSEKSEPELCSYLLIWVGEKGRDIYSTWTIEEEEKGKLSVLYTKFEEYVTPKSNPVFARFPFHNKVQENGEHVEQFVTALQIRAKDCAFKDPDEMIRDTIVFGTNSQKVREKLINEGAKLTLAKAIEIARNYESAREQLRSMGKQEEVVHGIQGHSKGTSVKKKPKQKHRSEMQQSNTKHKWKSDKQQKMCEKCGGSGTNRSTTARQKVRNAIIVKN